MTDQATSLLVNSQLPEFVREEHPNFIAFLEAYYEYLENKQGTQLNDLVKQSKQARYFTDVDSSVADFEENFFNTYANLFPQDVQVDKAVLLKNVLPLYLAKGNEKSFKLLFRLLYNEEVEVLRPKTNVLKLSSGNWLIENIFRAAQEVYSTYTGDGTEKTFRLAQAASYDEVTVYVNDVELTSGYGVRKELRKLVFDTAPANNSIIKVLYDNFNFRLLTNRKIIGKISGASALIEKVTQRTVNAVPAFELYINSKTLVGDFENGESGTIEIIDPDDETLITIEVLGLSNLSAINIINGGSSYNVGDPVIITGGGASKDAQAIVSEVFSGFVNKITAVAGGAGFKIGSNVNVVGLAANSALVLAIDGVDTSGQNTANSFVVNTDRIADLATINISDADYGFNSSVIPGGENANTKLIDAFSFTTITSIGAITNVAILFSNTTFATAPTLDADSAQYTANSTTHFVLSSGSLGRIGINDGGNGYEIGDEIIFSNKEMQFGIGAAAAVTNVSSNGAITQVELQPSRIIGTANTFGASNSTVIGTNTLFETTLRVGDRIIINNESRFINTITSNTSLNVNVNFSKASTNKPIGLHGQHLVGGQNYEANKLPTITVSSLNGANANLSVIALMGDGENLSGLSTSPLGEILNIRITDGGFGYEFLPQIILTGSGDGTAQANGVIETTYVTIPGRWTTSDGILSASERVVQGREYYVDYSYVLSSSVEFRKFKEIFKNLVHPAGFIQYAEYKIDKVIAANNLSTDLVVPAKTISGTVNVFTGNIFVTGTNTKFNISNTNNVLTIGTQIAVNSEIRTVNSIFSNGVITVSSAFTQTANDQTLVIVT
jgi:hypothetical protein